MYRIISKLLLLTSALLTLWSCNLREDLLLPPNLDPKEYIIESTIRVYYDHLIKSSNDTSYIYIPKESIADSLLWYGDVLSFQRVDSLLERDSLALVTGTTTLSQAYKLSILRSGTEIILDSIPAFATIYTDSEVPRRNGAAALLSHRYMLAATDVQVYSYGMSRCFFDINGSGDIQLVDFHSGTELSLTDNNTAVEALLANGSDYLQFWIPAGFLGSMGDTVISLVSGLEPAQVQTVQELYPGFSVHSKVINVSTQNSGTSSSVPILHYTLPSARHFGTQWLKLGDSTVNSWQSGSNTWQIQNDKLITFVNGAGSYLLIDPLSEQQSLQIDLDGSYTQLFMQDVWIDLKDTILPDHTLRVELAPDTSGLIADYFSANPFSISGGQQSFELTFAASGAVIETLPDNNWLEFGILTQNPQESNRLLRAYRTATQDHIDYKTYAADYDSGHYTVASAYLYSGVTSSGIYIYGAITESSSQTVIPCRKLELELQTARSLISWNDPALSTTGITIAYDTAITEQHPWLSGSPYTLNSASALMKITATRGSRRTDLLPANFFLNTVHSTALQSVVNLSLSPDYPRFIRYRAASAYAHNTFLYQSGRMHISPAFAGYLFDAAQLRKSRLASDLALFSRMVWDDYDWEFILDSANPLPAGSTMRVTVQEALTDSYDVFATQYQFSYLSPSYAFAIQNSPDFYAGFTPYIRLRQNTRTPNLLFSISEGTFYRIYSYNEGETADGWHFAISDGHISFLLAHDAEFAVVTDTQQHSQTGSMVVNPSQDFFLSLYQAQFVLPVEFVGNLVPLSTRIILNSEPADPPAEATLSTYSITFLNTALEVITPNFFLEPAATRWPYIYIPIPDYTPGQSVRLYYRNLLGETQELTRVTAFSALPELEFLMSGNCAVCFVNNSGLFYTTL